MPELMIDFITSLDGYGAAEGWPGWWGLEGPEYLAWLEDQPEASYTVLLGANTYRLMSGLAAEGEPGTDVLATLSKVVFSTTLEEPLEWPNTQLVSRDAVEAVREMKANGTAPMRTIGSLTLCRSLLTAGLVDRFRVVVFPVITGSTGRDRIYDGYPDVSLEMLDSRTFDGRLQLVDYRPTVLTGPSGLRLERDTWLVAGGPRWLFDHVKLPVRDLASSRAFYERALQPLGVRVIESSQGLGFAIDDQDFWITEQEPAAGSVHIAFAAPDRETVAAFYAAAVEAGGVDNGRPGLRPHYHSGYYAAFVLDPDGNNVEAVFHGDH